MTIDVDLDCKMMTDQLFIDSLGYKHISKEFKDILARYASKPSKKALEACIKSDSFRKYIDLYYLLQVITLEHFKDILSSKIENKYGSFEFQECSFNLFCVLKLVCTDLNPLLGDFNNAGLLKRVDYKDYIEKESMFKRGKVDFLAEKIDRDEHGNDVKTLLMFTSKNYKTEKGVEKYDIENILKIYDQRKGEDIEGLQNEGYHAYYDKRYVGFVTRNKESFLKRKTRDSKYMYEYEYSNNNGYVIDQNDLIQIFSKFRSKYRHKHFEELPEKPKKLLQPRPHQILCTYRLLNLINSGVKNIVLDATCRSGKSYIMALITSMNKNNNKFFILSSYMNSTLTQFIDLFREHKEFEDVEIVDMSTKVKAPKTDKFIIISSVQRIKVSLNVKKEEIKWLKNIQIDVCMIDECQRDFGTKLSKKMFDLYFKDSQKIFISGTTESTEARLKIPEQNCVRWTNLDNRLCESYPDTRKELFERHGEFMVKISLDKFSPSHIKKVYREIPKLCIYSTNLTQEERKKCLEEIEEVKTKEGIEYGWSPKACLLLTDEENSVTFQQPKKVLDILKKLYGDCSRRAEMNSYKKQILEECCNEPTNRNPFESEEGEDPRIIAFFLPPIKIGRTSIALQNLWDKNSFKVDKEGNVIQRGFLPDVGFVRTNTYDGTEIKEVEKIEQAIYKAKLDGKRSIALLTGEQCSAAITIKNCDVVVLLNHTKSIELYEQIIYRCMNSAKGKTKAFVVNMNLPDNVVDFIVAQARKSYPRDSTKRAIDKLRANILNINFDMLVKGRDTTSEEITNMIYDNHRDRFDPVKSFNRMNLQVPKEAQHLLSKFFEKIGKINKNTGERKECSPKNPDRISDGIERQRSNSLSSKEQDTSTPSDREQEINNDEVLDIFLNPIDIIKVLFPFLCILTIDSPEIYDFQGMIEECKRKGYENILIDQIHNMWNKKIDYKELILVVSEIWNLIKLEHNPILQKELKDNLLNSLKNKEKFCEIIDNLLRTQISEKKYNAEVTTPRSLRLSMINLLPKKFWESPKKVFEPCSGKAGFLILIYNMFFKGLAKTIPDLKERERVILEECIYFADITEVNIFIGKLVLDPENKYKLNYYRGNTLEMDVEEEFGIKGFDAVIGNPPYQNRNGNKGSGNILWDKFTTQAIEQWLVPNRYLCYVHPSGWRQINNKCGDVIKSNQIHYLNMNSIKDGQNVFGCATNYDYYILQKCQPYKDTVVVDYNNKTFKADIMSMKFIPNHSFEEVKELIDVDKTTMSFVCDKSTYETRKKWVSKEKTQEYRYPCVYSIDKKNEINTRWSSTNEKGHYDIIKFILSNGEGFVKDTEGEYACTEWAYYIPCLIEDMNDIEECVKSRRFKNLVDAVKITSNKYNYRILGMMRERFWLDFI